METDNLTKFRKIVAGLEPEKREALMARMKGMSKEEATYCDISSDLSHIPEEITNKTSANIQALEDARIKLSSLNERIKNYGKKS